MVHPNGADGQGKYENEETFLEIKKDTAFSLLSDSKRREILYYFIEESDVAHIDELTEQLYRREMKADKSTSHAEILTKLHHIHLPKLDATNCIQYDAKAMTAKYEEPEMIEDLLRISSQWD